MRKLFYLSFLISGVMLLTSCTAEPPAATSKPTRDFQLTPFHTATLTVTITPTPLDQPTITPKPTITPTPRVYVVRENDTLLGIAYFFGITLEELQAANPDVNPALLSIGTSLIIPPSRAVTATMAAPTPAPFALTQSQLKCLSSNSGGLHCFSLVENERKSPAEYLTAEFTLINAAGDVVITRVVPLPLKRLQPGNRIPFYTYFAPPLPANGTVSFKLLTATKADVGSENLFPLGIEITALEIIDSGTTAILTGSALLHSDSPETSRLTLVAVAYDAGGNVIGLRRIEESVALSGGSPYAFTLEVYSTGGKIATVEIYGEAEN